MLKEILADIIKVDDVLMVVKSNGATIEMRSNSLSIRQKEKWITIGENDGPCHMHVNNEMIKNAEFVIEKNSTMICMQNIGRKSSSNHILSVNYMESFEPLTKLYS